MKTTQFVRQGLSYYAYNLFSNLKVIFPLICVGILMGSLITAGKWYYLIGLVFATIYCRLALQRQWGMMLAMIFFVDLIWGYVMRRGFHKFFDFPVDHALFLLLGTVSFYLVWRNLRLPKVIRRENFISTDYVLIIIFTVLLFIGWLTWFDYRPDITLTNISYEWLRFGIVGLGAFILGTEVGRNPRQIRHFIILLFTLLALISIEISARIWLNFELIQVQHGLNYYREQRFGIYGHDYTPLFVGRAGDAFLMTIALCLGIGIILNSSSKLLKIGCAISLIPIIEIIVSSLDRTAWLTGILVLLLWSFNIFRFSSHRRKRPFITILAVVLCLFLLITPQIIKSDFSNFSPDFLVSDRYKVWYSTIKALPDFPLFGIGYRNVDKFSFILSQANPSVIYILPLYGHYGQYENPHNSYLELMTFAGIPAFLVFVFFLVRIFYAGRNTLRLDQSKDTRLTVSMIYIVLLSICFFSFFKHHLWVWPVNLLFWMLSGIIVSVSQNTAQTTEHENRVTP